MKRKTRRKRRLLEQEEEDTPQQLYLSSRTTSKVLETSRASHRRGFQFHKFNYIPFFSFNFWVLCLNRDHATPDQYPIMQSFPNHAKKHKNGLSDVMKMVAVKPKLQLPTSMPTLNVKPEIDIESGKYKELNSYVTNGIWGLKLASSVVSSTFL